MNNIKHNNFFARIASPLILVWLVLFFQCGFAQTIDARSLFLPIDMSQPHAHVHVDIKVSENRLYVFYLNVHYRNEEERRRVVKLVGGSGKLNNGGGYANPGLGLLVHIKVTDSAGDVVLDNTHQANGNAGHGLGPDFSGEYLRELDEIRIKPGLYHFEVTILEPVSEFRGLECAVSIGTRPHTPPTKE